MNDKPRLNKLFSSARIGTLKLKNRIVMAPMTTDFATADGYVTEQIKDYYAARARGGVGLVIVEATCVESPRGRGLPYGLVIDDDKFIPGLTELAGAVRKAGAKVALQIYHAGPSTQVTTSHMQGVGASPVDTPGFVRPRELDISEIQEITARFATAAARAKRSGFDGVEIHAAHYYLLAHFLSPAWNKRTDAYGGSLKKRARFLIEVLQAVRQSVGDVYPVWLRMNGKEYGIENGITPGEAGAAAKMFEQAGADAIHVSGLGGGKFLGYTTAIMYDPPGNFVDAAAEIKKSVSVPVIAVGKLSPQLGESVLQEGKADLIALGRPLITDPDLPNKAASGKFEDIRPCLSCRVCGDIMLWIKHTSIRCQANAAVGREREYEIGPAALKKRVMVVGAGPAGMEAARVAALRGHDVQLFDSQSKLGGQLLLASLPPCKDDVRQLINYLTAQITKLGVKVVLGRKVTPELVASLNPEALILATGVLPVVPRIPGIDSGNVLSVEDVLTERCEVGQRVVVIGGGMVGCEVADYLAERNKKVTLVEMLPELAIGLGSSVRTRLLSRLSAKSVASLTSTTCVEIAPGKVTLRNTEGMRSFVDTDSVVVAAGSKANRDLFTALGGKVRETHLAGDCVEPRRILEAVADGFLVARGL